MKTPILETSRLWLKPLKEEDAPGAFLWTGDPKVSWYMRYETHESLEDTKQWLREEEKQLDSDLLYDFGFHKKDNDELIGSGGTIDVARGEKRAFALFLEHIGELDGCRGLTGTLQAHEHDHIGNAA